MISLINVGDEIILTPYFTDNEEKYKCEIIAICDQQLHVSYPVNIETNKTTFLLEGTQAKCMVLSKREGLFSFDCEVTGREKKNIPVIKLSYSDKEIMVKMQKREFVRVDAAVDVAVHPIGNQFAPFVTVTEDISAGGIAIRVKNPFSYLAGMSFITWLVLPMKDGQFHYVKTECEVVRLRAVNELKSVLSLKFKAVPSDVRQKLIRFCFERQLTLMKKRDNHIAK
ncbi:flagellar brake domain-containing protein [Bacillus sp. CRN 9]|nr:flagellar brake domain-containing protein [Bacillus sp. CRN 9]